MKNNTPKLMIVVVSLSLAACGGVNTPTTADSTSLYTGPVPKATSALTKDTSAADSLKVGPDNFTARDSSNHKAADKKSASAE
ncbi:MAG: hypothetical protein ACXVJB_07355 [Mucilaginibacter sp.]